MFYNLCLCAFISLGERKWIQLYAEKTGSCEIVLIFLLKNVQIWGKDEVRILQISLYVRDRSEVSFCLSLYNFVVINYVVFYVVFIVRDGVPFCYLIFYL